ncbi:hypothetical protein AB6A40_005791 [Gnathostoma spinigerum]|uniref:Uncharacterized protein n=1 Tax=Gnathostoma spinigerum TaxID=75299 RepID=A0ABD6EQW6_9BILA
MRLKLRTVPIFTVFLVCFINNAYSITCYTGLKFSGTFQDGTTKECDSETAYCYIVKAELAFNLFGIRMAGCSVYRCMFARNTCFRTVFSGFPWTMQSGLIVCLAIIILSFDSGNAITCYSGTKIGGSITTSKTEECISESSYCYIAKASIVSWFNLEDAGCSYYRCMFTHNSCFKTNLLGIPISFCCCNERDLCNVDNTEEQLLEDSR